MGVYAPGVYAPGPRFCGKFESELRSGFRARNGELKESCFSGSEGDTGNSPFRCATPKITSYSGSPYTKPTPYIFGFPRVFWADFQAPTVVLRDENVKKFGRPKVPFFGVSISLYEDQLLENNKNNILLFAQGSILDRVLWYLRIPLCVLALTNVRS